MEDMDSNGYRCSAKSKLIGNALFQMGELLFYYYLTKNNKAAELWPS
jgi:hypothetical protein